MGQILSEPVTQKESEEGGDKRLFYGTSCMQGWRISMEDAHVAILDLRPPKIDGTEDYDSDSEKSAPIGPGGFVNDEKNTDHPGPVKSNHSYEQHPGKISFFGVFDGHGGASVAEYCGKHMANIIARQIGFQKHAFTQALKDGFLSTDRDILQVRQLRDDPSGCTATTALFTDRMLYVANAGDSRTVLGVRGYAKPMSFDHKPTNLSERYRIQNAGGYVDAGRVNGNLALSRAIGDFHFKMSPVLPPERQIVTAMPDVTEHEITTDDEFLVLACDGIWDCKSSQEVVEYIRRGIAERLSLVTIAEKLMDSCLGKGPDTYTSGLGCDNMTVVIVGILNGMTKEQWYDKIEQRVADNDGPVYVQSVRDSETAATPTSTSSSHHRHHDHQRTNAVTHEDGSEGKPKHMTASELLQNRGRVIVLNSDGRTIRTETDTDGNDADDQVTYVIQAGEGEDLPDLKNSKLQVVDADSDSDDDGEAGTSNTKVTETPATSSAHEGNEPNNKQEESKHDKDENDKS